MEILNWIGNKLKCFWYGHDIPDEWLEYENDLVEHSIPCKRCGTC